MMDLIDIHSHILPRVDDGSESLSESIDMAKKASELGVRSVIATPHNIRGSYDFNISEIKSAVSKLSQELHKKHINLPLKAGSENWTDYDLDIHCKLADSNYFMLELPMHSHPSFIFDIIAKLKKNNLIPIIANPEQNSKIRKNPQLAADLINEGCLMQLSSDSLFKQRSLKDFSKFMLKNNAYHIIASNAHSSRGYDIYAKALKKISKIISDDNFHTLTYINPKKILDNKKIFIDKITFKEKHHTRFKIRSFLKDMFPI